MQAIFLPCKSTGYLTRGTPTSCYGQAKKNNQEDFKKSVIFKYFFGNIFVKPATTAGIFPKLIANICKEEELVRLYKSACNLWVYRPVSYEVNSFGGASGMAQPSTLCCDIFLPYPRIHCKQTQHDGKTFSNIVATRSGEANPSN